jgi:two-component system nitrate/nitrite response regulator NarL
VSPTRCLLADDHPALVAAVRDLLEENGFEVVGPASDGAGALALARAERPDVALVDYRMPGLGGAELVARLKESAPELAVLVYTAEADCRTAREALERGADGIVLKEAPLPDLVRALAAVRSRQRYVDPALAAGLVGAGNRGAAANLTEREREVLRRVADGRTHEQISGDLGIGTETVRTHLRKACERLGAATKTQAVASALRLGLID